MTNLTHYRKVFKSDHLGRADLEDFIEQGKPLIFTIKHVRQEQGAKVAGKKIDANIAYFKEPIKPLVLNATNSGVMRKLTNSCFIENWQDVTVQLYIDEHAKLAGEVVGGVRISPNPVKMQKSELLPEHSKAWNNAIAAYQRDGNLNAVLKRVNISKQNQQLIMEQASNG